jgi:xylulokinase
MDLIGLDVGTTGCKAVVFDAAGRPLGAGFREYGISTDASGKAEQDAEAVWGLAREALRDAVSAATARRGGTPPDVAGLSLSAQGDAIIALDRSGAAVSPALLGMDYRAAPQARACEERFGGEALFLRTGMRPHGLNSLCKALWLREERPEAWSRTAHVVTYADFVLGRLGAPGFVDETMASRTMAWDVARGAWDLDLLAALGLDGGLFSRAVPTGTVVGRLDPALARELGLGGAVALVAGAHDQPAGALGAGVVEDGDALLSTGTAEVLSTTFVAARPPPALYAGYYPCYASALPGRRFTFALNHVGGLLLRWYRDTWAAPERAEAARTGQDPYDLVLSGLPEGPSPLLFLPHLNGAGTPTCDPLSLGAIVGLTLASTRADVVKAILECQSYELLLNLFALREAGVRVERVTAAGGGARSPVWLQVKADVLGIPLRTLEVKEAACLGAAVIAGAGTGVFPSLAEGARRAVRFEAEYTPRPRFHEAYQRHFAVYRDLHAALRSIHARLRAEATPWSTRA